MEIVQAIINVEQLINPLNRDALIENIAKLKKINIFIDESGL